MPWVGSMYIRFISPHWAAEARTYSGFFGPAYACRWSRKTPDWIADELSRELSWFSDRLNVPERLYKATGRGTRNGVCWFRDTAAEHISRARYVCWLLGEAGVRMAELRSRRPGTVLWRDDHQIVALAERDARHQVRA
ncbi:hypothetical protein [Yoonia sp. R2-816]|uniref:hypothetical protein n=1 Tax=Yoonia sp. R2-816 TaxID=3342638 RepID=UPI00372A7971